MVKIAIAGASGSMIILFFCLLYKLICIVIDVAQELLHVLFATQKHEIVLLSRKVQTLVA